MKLLTRQEAVGKQALLSFIPEHPGCSWKHKHLWSY